MLAYNLKLALSLMHTSTSDAATPSYYWPNPDGYQQKLDAIQEGHPQTLLPCEFVRYVLIDRDGNRFKENDVLHAFEDKLGYAHSYMRSNLYRHPDRLPKPFQEKLSALSGKNASFWNKRTYSSNDAKDITFDMNVDISAIVAKYSNLSHAHPRVATASPNETIAR